MAENVIDLINRKNAEIERLQSKVEKLGKEQYDLCGQIVNLEDDVKYSKYEATISFAKRLCDGRVSNDPVVIAANVLLKELTEEAAYEIRKDLADL